MRFFASIKKWWIGLEWRGRIELLVAMLSIITLVLLSIVDAISFNGAVIALLALLTSLILFERFGLLEDIRQFITKDGRNNYVNLLERGKALPDLRDTFKGAERVYFLGLNNSGILLSNEKKNILIEALEKGVEVRFISTLPKIECTGPKECLEKWRKGTCSEQRETKIGTSHHECPMQASLRSYKSIKDDLIDKSKIESSNLQYRLTNYNMPYTMAVAFGPARVKALNVTMLSFSCKNDKRPSFDLPSNLDHNWQEFFIDQWKLLWDSEDTIEAEVFLEENEAYLKRESSKVNFESVESGKISESLSEASRKYFVGDATFASIPDDNVEMGVTQYTEYSSESPHYHARVTTYEMILAGSIKYLDVEQKTEFEYQEGDLVVIRRGTVYAQKAQADTKIIFLKHPSGNDKVSVESDEFVKRWLSAWDFEI